MQKIILESDNDANTKHCFNKKLCWRQRKWADGVKRQEIMSHHSGKKIKVLTIPHKALHNLCHPRYCSNLTPIFLPTFTFLQQKGPLCYSVPQVHHMSSYLRAFVLVPFAQPILFLHILMASPCHPSGLCSDAIFSVRCSLPPLLFNIAFLPQHSLHQPHGSLLFSVLFITILYRAPPLNNEIVRLVFYLNVCLFSPLQ